MIYDLKELGALSIRGRDSDLGNIADVYVDSENWVIRYLAVDSSRWLQRTLLISPFALERIYPECGELRADLTRERVRRSPPFDKGSPISRQYEGEFNAYYGYPRYWTGGGLWGSGDFPMAVNASVNLEISDPSAQVAARLPERGWHLCRMASLAGYQTESIDGSLGRIESLVFDDVDWAVRAVIVDGTKAWPEARIVVPAECLNGLDVPYRRVLVRGYKASYKACAAHDASIAREQRRHYLEQIGRDLRKAESAR